MEIHSSDQEQRCLWPTRYICTSSIHAKRVWIGIGRKISLTIQKITFHAFLSCLKNKELLILHFLYLGFQYGSSVMDHLYDPTIITLIRTVKNLQQEVHQMWALYVL